MSTHAGSPMNSNPRQTFAARIVSQFVSRDLTRRDLALDAFRGLMIMGMILVNHPPPTEAIYPPLVHASWNGWTLADTIFPGFLFAVGVAIRMSMVDARGEPLAGSAGIYGRIVRRFAIPLLLNFLLINFPYYLSGGVRLTGTLALIGWCYLIVATVQLETGWRFQFALALVALALQWAVYGLLPVPGVGPGSMLPADNAGGYVDHLLFTALFGGRTVANGSDPVILPLIGAVATTLAGLLAGHWMSSRRGLGDRLSGLFAAGSVLIVLGLAWDLALPVTKALWTGSYVVLMAGIALQLYSFLDWLTEICGRRGLARALQVAGVNALFFYVLAQTLQRVLVYGRVRDAEGATVRLRQFVHDQYFAYWLSGEFGSLVFAGIFLTVCFIPVVILYRKRIFLKL